MKLRRGLLVGLIVASLALLPVVLAASIRTYQVTGPVLEVTADKIVVQKGNDRWELARDSGTSITGELKVGEKVTIEYRMIATKVEVKGEKATGQKAPAKKTK